VSGGMQDPVRQPHRLSSMLTRGSLPLLTASLLQQQVGSGVGGVHAVRGLHVVFGCMRCALHCTPGSSLGLRVF